ncbi:hypothetical protein HY404_01090 [Candidatus Microgenomates bacterium]|nr:hypothetical protein [Candidatus Microgenomates bacterium]
MVERLIFNPNERPEQFTSVAEVRILSSYVTNNKPIENFGPFITKSEVRLSVLFAYNFAEISALIKDLFNYEESEVERIGYDIRGFRSYEVAGLILGTIGALEFHRIRKEIITFNNGRARLILEDLKGDKRDFILERGDGIWMPQFIFHTYETLEDDTRLTVIANTLLDPSNPATADTYSREVFESIKEKL